jgi:superoxide reductase
MTKAGDLYQSADWKAEKHVPVIDCSDKVEMDEVFEVTASIGKEIAHPNTTEHHIRWIRLFFRPAGEKFAYEVGNFEFNAHGESTEGANAGPVYTHHAVTASLALKKSGTIVATSFCNIHGLWENAKEIKVS